MPLLINHEIDQRICSELSQCSQSVMLISAFCKTSMIEHFDEYIQDSISEKILLVRYRREDILSGASDLSLYPYCKTHGWKLYFRLDLHAKTYIFDRTRCIVGSSNATQSGMNYNKNGNWEIAGTSILEEKDSLNLRLLLAGSLEVNDEIYSLMSDSLSQAPVKSASNENWSPLILDQFKPNYDLLFTEDFPSCPFPQECTSEDFLFMNYSGVFEKEICCYYFEQSKCYCWLLSHIENAPNKELYFGELSACLHSCLLNEPKPYRKDVKLLLSNLLSWITELDCPQIIVDRPNHSQRARLR